MNATIKTRAIALCILLALSCKKENGNLQSSRPIDESVRSDLVAGKYPVVKIGTQKWMARNLDVARYRNGDKIPQVKDSTKWKNLTTGAWCWYNNDSANGAIYGKLYNWYAVNDPRGLAPIGWHIPTDAEWDTLAWALGGPSVAGGKLKDTGTIEAGTGLWYAPNVATNSSGFTALPGGDRSNHGPFGNLGYSGFWWSSTQVTNRAWYRDLFNYAGFLNKSYTDMRLGSSVRCIKDSI